MARVEARDQHVDEMVGVAVADQRCPSSRRPRRCWSRANVPAPASSHRCAALVAEQVAARRPAGSRPRPRGPEDRQFHAPPPTGWAWAARTSRSSGPRKTSARRWKCSGSPVDRNSCTGAVGSSRSRPACNERRRTRPWRSPRPRTPARRPGRAPAGAAPTAAGSACIPGSSVSMPLSTNGSRYPRAAVRSSVARGVALARRARRRRGRRREWSLTRRRWRRPRGRTRRSSTVASVPIRPIDAVARGVDRGACAGIDDAHHRDARAYGDVARSRATSTELHATTSIFTSRCTR